MTRAKTEFVGSISCIRELEDAIRATHKYTEGIETMRHSHPVQGTDFPSRAFVKYYEVYPETEISWDMPYGVAFDWLWRDVPCIDVVFRYDYRSNKASMNVRGGVKAVMALVKAIPAFGSAMSLLLGGDNLEQRIVQCIQHRSGSPDTAGHGIGPTTAGHGVRTGPTTTEQGIRIGSTTTGQGSQTPGQGVPTVGTNDRRRAGVIANS